MSKICENVKNECDTLHADSIPESVSDKIYNSIVKIQLDSGLKATGFFMKIKMNDKIMKCLFTCRHVISENDINNKIIIDIFYGKKGEEEKINIQLDKDIRYIKTFNEDVTLIEIIENDNIPEDKYLYPDLNYENGYNKYENKNFFLAGYPKNLNFNERSISSGRIIKILDYKFEHTLYTNVGSSGSPICNVYCDVIGIHTSGNLDDNINYGTFIGKIIDILNKKFIINNNSKNYIIAELYVSENDVSKDIRIINSYEQYKRENKGIENYSENENEKELQKNCEIKVNNLIIQFSYFYKFKDSGKYIIEYIFKNYITNTNYMFAQCTKITNINLSNFVTENVTSMRLMFSDCISLKNINLSNFNTQNVRDMDGMFQKCISLTNLNLSNFNNQNATNMDFIFYGCNSLKSLDLSNFNN